MTPDDIDLAVAEAKRFISRAEAAKEALVWVTAPAWKEGGYWRNNDTQATAALKRASMDLTRSLVAVRKTS